MQGQSTVPQDGGEHIIKFYPNPAISFITFDLQKNSDKGYDMQIFNFLGKNGIRTEKYCYKNHDQSQRV